MVLRCLFVHTSKKLLSSKSFVKVVAHFLGPIMLLYVCVIHLNGKYNQRNTKVFSHNSHWYVCAHHCSKSIKITSFLFLVQKLLYICASYIKYLTFVISKDKVWRRRNLIALVYNISLKVLFNFRIPINLNKISCVLCLMIYSES